MKSKKRRIIFTGVLIMMAVAAIIVALYIQRVTNEEYLFQKAYDEWLTTVFGKGPKAKELVILEVKRLSGLVAAGFFLVLALVINLRHEKKRPALERKCEK